jgi:PAS domain S-box-containing protein
MNSKKQVDRDLAGQLSASKKRLAELEELVDRRGHTEAELQKKNALLQAVINAQSKFIVDDDPRELFDGLLHDLLDLTSSEYGFIGEVLYNEAKLPYLKTHAITNIAWNEETRNFYEENAPQGLEFHNLETLFGYALKTEETVISNDPARDPRSGGLPKGHPPLNAFLGMPLLSGKNMVGMVGIANRPGGYQSDQVNFLEPFLAVCTSIVEAYKNNRLRRVAEEALIESEVRNRAVLHTVVDGIITIDAEGHILSFNPAAERIFQYTTDEIVGRKINELMPETQAAHHDTYLQNYLHTGKAQAIGIGREVTGKRKDGSLVPIDLAVSEMVIRNRHFFVGVLRDITERKETERKISTLNEALSDRATELEIANKEIRIRYRDLFEEAPIMMVITRNRDGQPMIEDCNQLFLHRLGYARGEVLHRSLADFYTTESRRRLMEEEGYLRALRDEFQEEERQLIGKGGRNVETLLWAVPEKDEDNTVFGTRAMFVDITERKQAEIERQRLMEQLEESKEKLHALAAHLQSVQEQERVAISREIHDELGQTLTAAKIDLTMIEQELAGESVRPAALLSEIGGIKNLLDSTIKHTKSLVSSLRPTLLDDLGLLPALEWQVEEFRRRTRLACDFQCNVDYIDLDNDGAIALYRIFQEAFTNIARHAQARNVRAKIQKNKEGLVIEIADDGLGFSQPEGQKPQTFGLLGIRERALVLGGQVQIVGVKDEGTHIKIQIPLAGRSGHLD